MLKPEFAHRHHAARTLDRLVHFAQIVIPSEPLGLLFGELSRSCRWPDLYGFPVILSRRLVNPVGEQPRSVLDAQAPFALSSSLSHVFPFKQRLYPNWRRGCQAFYPLSRVSSLLMAHVISTTASYIRSSDSLRASGGFAITMVSSVSAFFACRRQL